ncbi:TauD/TfdA dioxygenase family protein, partial [Psychrobacter sp. ENNN9_III]|uniref:TauD/TfdA dioxygenase family protein n=1 Tax=Psychrobacter sp. ENNN9_III TaxID=1254334 RepID=UPI00071E83CC
SVHPTGLFDNSAKDYQHITAHPLASAMGAEIRGVNLSDVSDDVMAEIEDALYRHKMIFFRDQEISFTDHENLILQLGEFGTDAYTTGVPGHPNIQPLIKEASVTTKSVFGSGWHVDSAFLECPPSIAINYGVDIPPYGGDTMFANAVLAYNSLSPAMQEMIAPLKVWMSGKKVLANMQSEKQSQESGKVGAIGNIELDLNTQQMLEGFYHPMVRTHPVSGEKSLYVDKIYACGIEGMTEDEARPLLDFFIELCDTRVFYLPIKMGK